VPIEGFATKSKGIQGNSQQLSVVNGTPRITHSIDDANRVLVVGVLSHSDEHTSQTAGVSMTAPNTVPLLRSLTVKHRVFVSLFALLKSAHTSVDS
jgi:hypothetical protein